MQSNNSMTSISQHIKATKAPRRTMLSLAVLILLGFAVWIIGAVFSYFHTGAEWEVPAPYAGNTLSKNAPTASWEALEPAIGEAPDAFLQKQISEAYLEAWQALHYAFRHKNHEVWKDHFAESYWPTLDSLLQSQEDLAVSQADLEHHLYLEAFALDKQLVSFIDKGVRIKKKITNQQSGMLIYNAIQQADFEVVMTLDDGKWKVRHLVRKAYTPPIGNGYPVADSMRVQAGAEHFLIGDEAFQVAGINYYPQETPWFDFWLEFDTAVVRRDLARIRDLNLNTVRTFVFYDLFGGAEPTEAMLTRLDTFMDLAAQFELKVVLTLFDFLPSYDIEFYASHEKHLLAMLNRYRHHPALLAWDLKNEPDLDFENHGRATVLDWLAYMSERVGVYDPDHPMTIGWSDASKASLLAEKLDFISFHFYISPDSLASYLNDIQQRVPDKTIMVSEFGLPTYNVWWLPGGHTEAEQAEYYQSILSTLAEYPNTSFISWTLYDFPELPDQVFGGPVWRTLPQQHYGIIRTDGRAKAAAAVLSGW